MVIKSQTKYSDIKGFREMNFNTRRPAPVNYLLIITDTLNCLKELTLFIQKNIYLFI